MSRSYNSAEYHEYSISNPEAQLTNVFYTFSSNLRNFAAIMILIYLVYFVPLSYLSAEMIKPVWFTIWSLVSFAGIASLRPPLAGACRPPTQPARLRATSTELG